MRSYLTIAIMFFAALAYGCANPAANKPKATVANAAPESDSAKPANAERLVISPENSKVEFVAAKVTRSHNGSFKQFAGAIDLDKNSVESSRVSIDIQTISVVTDEPDLTKHLQTPDFFDVAKYPKANFTSTKIEPAGGANYNVTGNFDLHGVKKSIQFPATITAARDSVSVGAEFSINRQDFGLVIRLTLKVPRKQ